VSVYKRSYGAYHGPLTPQSSRVAVLARYGFAEVWSSKITIILFTVCFVPPVMFMFTIYLMNNPAARLLLGGNVRLMTIDQQWFLIALQIQSWLALAFSAWISPRLVSADLSDNALPIFLSRPITRFEYVLGKLIVLVTCLSAVTWLPVLLLFLFQSYSSPIPWAGSHLFIAFGVFFGALIWIAFLSLFTLALSSWVKWRVVATGLIFAAIIVPAGVGGIFNAVVRTKWGMLLNLPHSMSTVWQRLLQVQPNQFEVRHPLPLPAIAMMLLLVAAGCVAALNARIRAREVVRG
jgi:ABC-type transport system involved in multi-copper enzyme maturation permease subunit